MDFILHRNLRKFYLFFIISVTLHYIVNCSTEFKKAALKYHKGLKHRVWPKTQWDDIELSNEELLFFQGGWTATTTSSKKSWNEILSKITSLWEKAPKELRLVICIAGVFVSFLNWGVFQERITGHKYISTSDPSISKIWKYPVFLNNCMAFSGFFVSLFLENLNFKGRHTRDQNFNITDFIKPALSYSLGSPFGYTALHYINFPLLILAKSCKLIPVMLMGILIARKVYKLSEYLAVLMISIGVAMYSFETSSTVQAKGGTLAVCFGLGLVLINLLLDGYTAAHQDRINQRSKVNPLEMMKYMNMWALVFNTLYLLLAALFWGSASELSGAIQFCQLFPQVLTHILKFVVCASTGQVFVYLMIKEFGALAYITATILRKFFSILISIAVFGHKETVLQWLGIALVFGGLGVNIYGKYTNW